jgi:putative transcriptional regulator
MPVTMRIGELARHQGLTIKALAERAGVAYNTAHALATGRATRIDLDTLDRICAALQVPPGDLLIRHVAEEPIQPEHERGGRYGTDPDRTAGSGS